MKILAFAEQRERKFKKSAYEVTQAAKRTADQLGDEAVALVIGDSVEGIVGELGAYGASRVLMVQDPRLHHYSTTAYSRIVAEIAQREHASILFLPASQMGKDMAPRISGKLAAGVVADCVNLRVDGGEIIATRPAYAGKALLDTKVTSPTKIFTLRPNVFTASAANGAGVMPEKLAIALTDADFGSKVTNVKLAEGRPDVTEAGVIVSGGRGLKAPENFHLIEKLADVLGAAVGASRAVVDAGWRPHDEQVGQKIGRAHV